MSFTHSIGQSWAGSGRGISGTISNAAEGQQSIGVTVPDSTTDMQVDIAIDVSETKSIYMKSDQALTVETNNGGAPVDTIVLIANQPYVWYTNSYFTNQLETDVTALFLTNASGSAATFELELLEDPTP